MFLPVFKRYVSLDDSMWRSQHTHTHITTSRILLKEVKPERELEEMKVKPVLRYT